MVIGRARWRALLHGRILRSAVSERGIWVETDVRLLAELASWPSLTCVGDHRGAVGCRCVGDVETRDKCGITRFVRM